MVTRAALQRLVSFGVIIIIIIVVVVVLVLSCKRVARELFGFSF